MERISGNVVALAEYGEDGRALLLDLDALEGEEGRPYAVAYGYDPAAGTAERVWRTGDLSAACDIADPRVYDSLTVRWVDLDIVNALEEAGIEPTGENVARLESGLDRARMKEETIAAGWDCIERALDKVFPVSGRARAVFEPYDPSDPEYAGALDTLEAYIATCDAGEPDTDIRKRFERAAARYAGERGLDELEVARRMRADEARRAADLDAPASALAGDLAARPREGGPAVKQKANGVKR